MSSPSNHAIEQVAINVGGKLSGVGGVTAVGSGVAGKVAEQSAKNPEFTERVISLADIGVMFGITVGLLGFLVQLVFHIRRDRRERLLHRTQMERLRESSGHDS